MKPKEIDVLLLAKTIAKRRHHDNPTAEECVAEARERIARMIQDGTYGRELVEE